MTIDAWHAQQEAALTLLEAQWGETVDLLPWMSGTDAEYGSPGPDTTRVEQLGVLVLFKLKTAEVSTPAAIDSRIATADAYLETKDTFIRDSGLAQGDRVRMLHPKRNGAVYEVSYIDPEYHVRQRVYLMKLKEENE